MKPRRVVMWECVGGCLHKTEQEAAQCQKGRLIEDLVVSGVIKLHPQTRNSLRAEGIKTVSDLAARTKAELLSIPNLGRKGINDIREQMAGIGIVMKY